MLPRINEIRDRLEELTLGSQQAGVCGLKIPTQIVRALGRGVLEFENCTDDRLDGRRVAFRFRVGLWFDICSPL